MGYYIETPQDSKALFLSKLPGVKLEGMPYFDPTGERIGVCVIYNGPFEAAGIAYSKEEMEDFAAPDPRMKQWLSIPRQLAIELCPSCEGRLP